MAEACSQSFLDENARCHECGMFPPDHDIICPNNPALRQSDPVSAMKELVERLRQLECSCTPDFEAIADVAAKIESAKCYIPGGNAIAAS